MTAPRPPAPAAPVFTAPQDQGRLALDAAVTLSNPPNAARLPTGTTRGGIMAETQPGTRQEPDVTWMQQTALLDTTLTRIIRYAQLMQSDVRKGELNLAHADQLGHGVLTMIKQAAAISERAEITARTAAA